MTENNGILIQNIYYMLAYAFQSLRHIDYEKSALEKFEHIHDLLAALLARGISQRLKHGLHREYLPRTDALNVVRGRIDLTQTMRSRMKNRQTIVCEYDELTENNLFNRILKTAACVLLTQSTVKKPQKDALRRVLLFFGGIDEISPAIIAWKTISCRTQNDQMLMNLCYLTLHGLLLTTEQGTFTLASFLDDAHMHDLFERFVREYYRIHHPKFKAHAEQIKWNLSEKNDYIDFLPQMRTDITLHHGEKTLIIDTKYYHHTWQTRYEKDSLRSAHLYQLFTYVKNRDVTRSGNVSGMLLYARTSEALTPDSSFIMDGNKIFIRSLDLNQPFEEIRRQLDCFLQTGITEN